MADNKDIGKAFRDRLSNLKEKPSAKNWDSIVMQLAKQRKLFLWKGFISIATVLGVSFIIGNATLKQKITKDSLINTHKEILAPSDVTVNKTENGKNETFSKDKSIVTINTKSKKENKEKHEKEYDKLIYKEAKENKTKDKTEKIFLKKKNITNTSVKRRRNVKNEIRKDKEGSVVNKEETLILAKKNVDAVTINRREILTEDKNKKEEIKKSKANKLIDENKITSLSKEEAIITSVSQDANKEKELTSVSNIGKKRFLNKNINSLIKPITINNKVALEKIKKTKNDDVESQEEKWGISIRIAPTYYSFEDEPVGPFTYDENFALGVVASYAISKRFQIRAGLNHLSALTDPGVSLQTADGGEISFGFNTSIKYLEVPLDIKYKILNKRISIGLIAGASMLYALNRVDIQSAIDRGYKILDEDRKVRGLSYGLNLGFGVDYRLSKKFSLNIEPSMKIHKNSTIDGNDYRPYFYIIYAGVAYKF